MSTTDYTGNTSYIGGYDFVIDRTDSTDTIRVGALEAISLAPPVTIRVLRTWTSMSGR